MEMPAINWSLSLDMTMWLGGDEFYLSRPHTLLLNTYMLPYPYVIRMRNQISSLSLTGSGIPAQYL